MFVDYTLVFSAAQAITSTAPSTNVIDLTGAGVGNPPGVTYGTASVYGADMGVGDGMAVPKISVGISTLFVGAGASLTVSAQFAVDNANSPGAWQTYAETGAIPVAALVAGASIGTFDLPRVPQGNITQYPLPRFVRLNYTVGSGPFSAGAVNSQIVLQQDSQLGGINYPSNFSAGA